MKFYSEFTNKLYDTAEQCSTEEEQFRKAKEEEEKTYSMAIADLDDITALFKRCQKEQEAAYKKMVEVSREMHKKYRDFQHRFGRLPEKYYTNYIMSKLL